MNVFEVKAQSIQQNASGIDLSTISALLWSLIQQFLNCGLNSTQANASMKRQGPVERVFLRSIITKQIGTFDKKLFNATLAEGAKTTRNETQAMMDIVANSKTHVLIQKALTGK